MPTFAALFAVLLFLSPTVAACQAAPDETNPPSSSTEGVNADTSAVDASAGTPERSAAERFMAAGQNWRAAREMERYLESVDAPSANDILTAARAEAGWGGWTRVRTLLEGRSWLNEEEGALGRFLLARAEEEAGERSAAVASYGEYLSVSGGEGNAERRSVARLRRGLLMLETEERADALAEVARIEREIAGVGRWAPLLVAERLAEVGDTAAVRARTAGYDDGVPGLRARRARLRAARQADDIAQVRTLARQFRDWPRTAGTQAEFHLEGARAALQLGDVEPARTAFRWILNNAAGSGAARRAASELEESGNITTDDRRALAEVYARHGETDRAIQHYAAFLDAGSGPASERRQARLALAGALSDGGRQAEARETVRELADGDSNLAPEAVRLLARSYSAEGDREAAKEAYRNLAERFPDAGQAVQARYFLAGLIHEDGELGEARGAYREVIREHAGHNLMGLAMMRLAGLEFEQGRYAEAARVWEEYRERYPRGSRWLQATYWAGRAYDELGDVDRAARRYREVRGRDRISYYALRASEQLGVDFWPVPMSGASSPDPAARARVSGWMQSVDFLRAAELFEEANAEVDRVVTRAGNDAQTQYALGEALLERGYSQRAIRIGLRLEGREGRNIRNLRLQYPFPYRTIIEAEAGERDVDPFVAAALIRQESMFEPRATSPVGARGLMQVMPQTGREVAEGLEIEGWDVDLLYNPEVSAFIGTSYLADQTREYDGVLPAVFSAYNAGPHRIDVWRRVYPEYGDDELFTERIPFRETRDYVKILTRNLEVYRGLYGEGRP